MDKLKMHSPDLSQDNIAKLRLLFPSCVTEAWDEVTETMRQVVDFDLLREELGNHIAEGSEERYRLDWPGKRKASALANAPIAKALRPCRVESVNFDSTQNLFIEGDNLEALKLIQEAYLEKIKLIYIDPPYNTGNDSVYRDSFATNLDEYLEATDQVDSDKNRLVANPDTSGRYDSDWLSMLYSRIKLAHRILSQDGVLICSIDDNELHNLRKICDEIFGRKNFVCTLIWNKQHSQQQGLFKKYHEYVLVYARNATDLENISGGDGLIQAGALKKISRANPASEFTFPKGVRFEAPDGTSLKGTFGKAEKVTIVKGQLIAKDRVTIEPVTISAGWTQKEQMKRHFSGEEVFDSKGQRVLEFYFNSTGKLKCLKERAKITPPTILPKYGMVSEQSDRLRKLMGDYVFDAPKPVEMISDFISWFTTGDDLVMDFFAGSATTAEALFRRNAIDGSNRRLILVQLDEATPLDSTARTLGFENIADISKERIRRAGKKILADDCHPKWNRDVGFRALKIDTSNMKDVYYRPDELRQSSLIELVDNVKDGRKGEDLLFQVLVDWGVGLTFPIRRETLHDKTVFFVDDNALIACFDSGITEKLLEEMAGHNPLRVVFSDRSFSSDILKINAEQIFLQLSPSTEFKTI